jgi:hypothetical protein
VREIRLRARTWIAFVLIACLLGWAFFYVLSSLYVLYALHLWPRR